MKKLKLISVLLVSVVALTACGGSGGKVTNLNVSEFATKISDSSVTLVDVRTPGEFMSGHIAGATNIDFESAYLKAIEMSENHRYLKEELQAWINAPHFDIKEKVEAITAIFNFLNIADLTREEIKKHYKIALAFLQLIKFTDSMMQREI